MPTKAEAKAQVETMARRIVRDLDDYTGGRPQRWAPLHTITRRLVLTDGTVIEAALALAIERGWLLMEGSHSICLTDAGRRLAGA